MYAYCSVSYNLAVLIGFIIFRNKFHGVIGITYIYRASHGVDSVLGVDVDNPGFYQMIHYFT
jgi:hypothetical protein